MCVPCTPSYASGREHSCPLFSFPFIIVCLLSFFFFPVHCWMVKTGAVSVILILAINSFLILLFSPLPLGSLSQMSGCKNFPGGIVPFLQGGWVTFYMWQAHDCTFCLCMGLDVDWQGTNSNFILYSQSSAKPYSSPSGKGWTEGLEKLGVSEWVLIFNFALIHLRGQKGRLWVVQSLWGVSDTLKAFLPFQWLFPDLTETEGHRENS